jgi:hypothetical protein
MILNSVIRSNVVRVSFIAVPVLPNQCDAQTGKVDRKRDIERNNVSAIHVPATVVVLLLEAPSNMSSAVRGFYGRIYRCGVVGWRPPRDRDRTRLTQQLPSLREFQYW